LLDLGNWPCPQLAFLKSFRRIATRYEKTARNDLAIVHLACALEWLKPAA
jgi:transposase